MAGSVSEEPDCPAKKPQGKEDYEDEPQEAEEDGDCAVAGAGLAGPQDSARLRVLYGVKP